MLEIVIASALAVGLFSILGVVYNIPWWVVGLCGVINGAIIGTVA